MIVNFITMRRFAGDSNVYRATSSLAGRHPATSGFTPSHVTTSLPVDRYTDDMDSMSGLPDDDDDDDTEEDDYHDQMASFGSGYYDNDADRDSRRHGDGRYGNGWPPSSSSSASDRRLDNDRRPSDVHVNLKDVLRSSTTPDGRTVSRDTGVLERRRPPGPATSAAALRRHYIEDAPSIVITSSASTNLLASPPLFCLTAAVAAILFFRSAHVFPPPLPGSGASPIC